MAAECAAIPMTSEDNLMAKFLLVYRGGGMAETEEAQAASMAAWTGWFTSLGAAVVDAGNPTSQGKTVNADGSITGDGRAAASGYSILSADDLDGALKMAAACPIIGDGGSIDVCETFEIM